MDHYFQRQLFRPSIIPNNVRPTSFQGPSLHTMPGMGLPINATSILVPMYGESLFNQPKKIESEKPEASLKVSTQTISNEPQTVQQGAGKVIETELSDPATNDIDFESAKQVISEDVLNAFKSPVMRTAVVSYEPKEKVKKGKVASFAAKAPKFKFE